MAGAAQVVEAICREQLGYYLHFRHEWAFTTFGRSHFEYLLAHVALEWLLATVGWYRFESLLAHVAPE